MNETPCWTGWSGSSLTARPLGRLSAIALESSLFSNSTVCVKPIRANFLLNTKKTRRSGQPRPLWVSLFADIAMNLDGPFLVVWHSRGMEKVSRQCLHP